MVEVVCTLQWSLDQSGSERENLVRWKISQ
ncbi:hypothetical protein LKMONMHP_0101 [Methylobacterium organophilum]|uniref:Uncharacterized protein n=1 Tax=Methylobacterium organophilum TaxID=410 RepID=A0ABQ4T594_METOR|nr:hypothetical protein LKMONMHP_0101 [Methylobacterium organophilum]